MSQRDTCLTVISQERNVSVLVSFWPTYAAARYPRQCHRYFPAQSASHLPPASISGINHLRDLLLSPGFVLSRCWPVPYADHFLGPLPSLRQIEHRRISSLISRVQSSKGKLLVGRRIPHGPIYLRCIPQRQQIRRTGCCVCHRRIGDIYALRDTSRRCEHRTLFTV